MKIISYILQRLILVAITVSICLFILKPKTLEEKSPIQLNDQKEKSKPKTQIKVNQKPELPFEKVELEMKPSNQTTEKLKSKITNLELLNDRLEKEFKASHQKWKDKETEYLTELKEKPKNIQSMQSSQNQTNTSSLWTPLHESCAVGNYAEYLRWVSKTSIKEPTDSFGRTPFHIAIIHKHTELVSKLALGGASIEKRDSSGKNAILHAAASKPDIISFLHKMGADFTDKDHQGNNALHLACLANQLNNVKHLIQKGLSIDQPTLNGLTFIHLATLHNFETMIQFAISQGANVNRKTDKGLTPLHMSIQKNYTVLSGKLLRLHADVNSFDTFGRSPLHYACTIGNRSMIQLLISFGAITTVVDNYQQTPLHYAVLHNQKHIISTLCEQGATVDASDLLGRTPLYYSIFNNKHAMISILLQHGANMMSVDNEGKSCLDLAKKINNEKVLLALEVYE